MRWRDRQERVAKWMSLAVSGYLLAGLVWVQVTQRVFRWRAERLMREVEALTPGQSGWEEFERLQGRWGSHAVYKGKCVPESCDYTIHFSVPLGYDWFGPEPSARAERVRRVAFFATEPALLAAHAHWPFLAAQVSVREGRVWRDTVRFYTAVPEGAGPGWRDRENTVPGYVPYSGGAYGLIAGYEMQSAHLDREWRARIRSGLSRTRIRRAWFGGPPDVRTAYRSEGWSLPTRLRRSAPG